jgi:ribosomal protein S18 acetylase RimI-like enzyme
MTIRELILQSNELVLELLSLQVASYRVEAELIGFDDIPLLQDGIHSLREAGEVFLGYYMDAEDRKELAGAISYTCDGSVVTICRMMVHPKYFRKGIAKSLLQYFLQDQQDKKASRFIVSTGTVNVPAVNLYKSFGFIERRVMTIAPHVTLTTFERLAVL